MAYFQGQQVNLPEGKDGDFPIFHSYVNVYQRVNLHQTPLNHHLPEAMCLQIPASLAPWLAPGRSHPGHQARPRPAATWRALNSDLLGQSDSLQGAHHMF